MTEAELLTSNGYCYKCYTLNDLMVKYQAQDHTNYICRPCKAKESKQYRASIKLKIILPKPIDQDWLERAKANHAKIIAKYGVPRYDK